MDSLEQTFGRRKIGISYALGEKQLRLKLSERTRGAPEKTTEVAMAVVRLPFGDIARNRTAARRI